mgnify:FL=1
MALVTSLDAVGKLVTILYNSKLTLVLITPFSSIVIPVPGVNLFCFPASAVLISFTLVFNYPKVCELFPI